METLVQQRHHEGDALLNVKDEQHASADVPLPRKKIAQLTVVLCGITIAWAVQYVYTTPTLRTLGLSHTLLAYSWLAGTFLRHDDDESFAHD